MADVNNLGDRTRITLRMPEALAAKVRMLAAAHRQSSNAWIVDALMEMSNYSSTVVRFEENQR